jgi:hypothetical protein
VSSEPPALFLAFQLLLVSPLLVPVWVAGLVRLWREPRLRGLALTWPVLALVFLLTGGKPYYLAGLYPLLLAAGAGPAVTWARRSRARARLLAGAVALSGVVAAFIALPALPPGRLGPVVAMNEDVAEMVGWPALVRSVAEVYDDVPGGGILLTANYGEAGAIDRFGPALGLPHAYSGHNGYADWGPPRLDDATALGGAGAVVTVGLSREELLEWFGSCELAARIDNGVGVDNEEQGAPVHVCRDQLAGWEELWPRIRRLG